MRLHVLAISSVLLAAGCVSAVPEGADSATCPYKPDARAAAATPDGDESDEEVRDPKQLAARGGGTSIITVRVDGKYITGPGVSLGRYDEEGGRALRGTMLSSVVDLRIDEGSVDGAIDSDPVKLAVVRKGTSLDVSGLVPGRVSRLHIDEQGMRGLVGGCTYDLRRAGAGFTGRRACGTEMSPFTLDLPDTMASWGDSDVAAVLVLFLRKI